MITLLLVRGVAGVLARDPQRAVAGGRPAGAAVVWPGDEARSFASQFTRAYLSWSPRHPGRYARAVQGFVSPSAATSILPRFARDSRQVVQGTAIARIVRVGRGRALVTVAATVQSDGVRTEYLTVPVARDAAGGLVVYDLPSFSSAPARGAVQELELEPVDGSERAGIEDLLTRFFTGFLAGRSSELEYLVPAGTRIAALERPYELVGVDGVELEVPARGRWRFVLATVRARDAQSRAIYPLRYRLRLLRADGRWFVAAVNATPREG